MHCCPGACKPLQATGACHLLRCPTGIGGVHRGGQDSLDISADLTELGRTCMAVVCAGVKSVLDIPRTLEVLETQGVCVAAVGTGVSICQRLHHRTRLQRWAEGAVSS